MPNSLLLVRYGQVPEVARFVCELPVLPVRGERVVARTHRGLQLGTVLESVQSSSPDETDFIVERTATPEDQANAASLQARANTEFTRWQERIDEWGLTLELVDLEWTLDGSKQILYVLTERGPETTNLALQAAAGGFGIIEVQPVSAEGLVTLPSSGGGCGTGGGGCGCSH